jgi:hypothetical protein
VAFRSVEFFFNELSVLEVGKTTSDDADRNGTIQKSFAFFTWQTFN